MTLAQWLAAAERELTATGSPDPRTDAEWIAVDILGVTRSMLGLMRKSKIDDEHQTQLDTFLARRAKGEPLQYIEGTAWFMGMEFGVDPRVLIPRQDTETLCEAALECARPGMRIADVCTGSGALGISIKKLAKGVDVTLTDISADALTVARGNAVKLGADVRILKGDLLDALGSERFDMIVCNPPYLTADDMTSLQKEVTFEPSMALAGGEDGLDFYRRLARDLPEHLNEGAHVLVEVGMGQADAVADMLNNALEPDVCEIIDDINGIGRVVALHMPAEATDAVR